MSLVQSAANNGSVNQFVTPISVSAVFGSSVTTGNVIVVFIGCTSYGIASNSVTAPSSVTDTLGNTYTQRQWQSSLFTAAGGGIYTAISASSGSCTVTVSCPTATGVGIDPANALEVIAAEISGLPAMTVQSSNIAVGATGTTCSITDSSSTTVTSTFPATISSAADAVIDLKSGSINLVLAMESISGAGGTATLATITPGAYSPYSLITSTTAPAGNNGAASLTAWIATVVTLSTTAFRKTRSILGTRTGARQSGRL